MTNRTQFMQTALAMTAGLILGASATFAAGADRGHHDAADEMPMADHHGDDMPMADHHGDDAGDQAAGDGHHGAMPMAGMPGHADEATRTVEISMHDNFYDPESIDAKAGETIRFVITNNGAFVHEFNIGTADMHAAHQEEMMMMVEHGVIAVDHINYDMMKMDMGDGKTMEHNDPNSALLEPGQSAEIVWKFTEAMAMEFACNVPGHYDSGMMGDITVTP